MMRAVLAYDGSAGSEQAAALVDGLTWPPGAQVRVIAVIEPHAASMVSLPPIPPGVASSPELDAQISQYLDAGVSGVVTRLRSRGIAAEGVVLRGRPATVVADEAAKFAADVVVVGSRGHGSIASLVLGSVSAELVDVAPCPVLVARRPVVRRVLVASDGSPSAERAEACVAGWPILADAEVRIVSVAEVTRAWHTGVAPTMHREVLEAFAHDLETAKAEHEDIAARSAERLLAAGRTAGVSVRVGDPAAEIVAEGEGWNADLVVLGSRGHTGLRRVLLGSVARNVLHGTSASVLVVRDPSHT